VNDDDVTLLGVFYDPSAPPLIAPVVAANTVTAVPEPSTWPLLVISLLIGLKFAARRRSRSTK
jgi:hypothetical protein